MMSVDASRESESEREDLIDMLAWAYSKLHYRAFDKQEDALMLDRIKLLLEHGIRG